MNGAQLIVNAAAASGIEYCFANPGTTEIPLVAAMASAPALKPVLSLFEGVCTGAADGYGLGLSGSLAMCSSNKRCRRRPFWKAIRTFDCAPRKNGNGCPRPNAK